MGSFIPYPSSRNHKQSIQISQKQISFHFQAIANSKPRDNNIVYHHQGMNKVFTSCIIHLIVNISGQPVHIGAPETRHHSTSKPSEYNFAKKVENPCGAGREYLETVTKEEVIHMIGSVEEEITETTSKMVNNILIGKSFIFRYSQSNKCLLFSLLRPVMG